MVILDCKQILRFKSSTVPSLWL